MVGSRAEKHHSSKVGKNWVMMGFCRGAGRCIRRGQSRGFSLLRLHAPSPAEPWASQLSGPHVRSPGYLEGKG